MPPNILLLCTDQQRYDVLGAYGNTHIQTPAIDGLAAAGVRFDRCYSPSTVCAPARASLLTGLYPHAHGLWANGVTVRDRQPLIGRQLADAGYDCGLAGKLHIGACFGGRDEKRHDDGYRFFSWAHDPSHGSPNNAYHQWLAAVHPRLWAAADGAGDNMPTEAHYSHWVAEEAIRFLRADRPADQPFYFVANFYDPHHPFVAPPEYVERFRGKVPPPIRPSRPADDKPPIQAETSKESYAGHAPGFLSYTSEEIQEIIANYYAMVALIDDEVSRILGELDRLGLAEDTLVVFTSDHGEMLGDHGQLLKGPLFYEGAVRVPMILRWPGRLPVGSVRPELVELHDLYATFLAAAGLPAPAHNNSVDLLPVARGESAGRGWALSEYRDSGHPLSPPVHATMLRTAQYKLVVHHGAPSTSRDRTGELYDLDRDPAENQNLWNDPDAAAIRQQLTEQLLDILVGTEDRSAPREAFW